MGDVRETLHDRVVSPGPGHLELTGFSAERAATMRAAGERWYELMTRARDVLHPLPWEMRDEAEIADLRALGGIGELRP